MAVIIRKQLQISGEEISIEAFLPEGKIDKEARIQAKELDEYLSNALPKISRDIQKKFSRSKNIVEFWFQFGVALRELTQKTNLILEADIQSGDLWQAIWHYLPDALRPSGSDNREFADIQQKRKDVLSLCYEISAFSWDEISWLKRWDDWHQICFRPGIIRDKRILLLLGKEVMSLTAYPTQSQFREIVKKLGDFFTTRVYKDSSFLSDKEIEERVTSVVHSL